ncbi:MAG: DUF4302 domain-containing protein [Prevotella sp.]|nr:DUF4302 domain-containing protein [Prevotella sp.]
MRKKHIYIMLLMALPMLLLTSCLKNQEDLFQESSSARMENYLNTYEALLKSSEYGWAFEYYAGTENQEYGGWTYALKFNDKDVDVYSDQALNPTEPLNSLYKLGNDDGPILTFDTYNDLIHLFATPWGSSSGYEAYGGDFEFIIMGVNETKDVITLKGKRSGNIMYLRKLDKSPAEFMANVIEMEESITLTNFIGSGLGANLDYDYHSIFIGPEEQYDRFVGYDVTMTEEEIMQYTRAFLMTENGIRLYEPVEYNGVKIQSFIYDIEARTFTCTDEGATNITLGVFIPEGYNEWAGDYYITCSPRLGGVYTPSRIPVSIEPEGDGFTLNLKGLNDNFDVKMQFDRQTKQIEIMPQVLGRGLPNGHVAYLAAWDTNQGYVNYTVGGMKTQWSENNQYWKLVDNGRWAGYSVDGFIVYEFTDANHSTRVGECPYPDWYLAGSTRLVDVMTLEKR